MAESCSLLNAPTHLHHVSYIFPIRRVDASPLSVVVTSHHSARPAFLRVVIAARHKYPHDGFHVVLVLLYSLTMKLTAASVFLAVISQVSAVPIWGQCGVNICPGILSLYLTYNF